MSIASNIDEFLSINRAGNIRKFFVHEFNKIATKFAMKKPLGYINKFVPLLIVSDKNI